MQLSGARLLRPNELQLGQIPLDVRVGLRRRIKAPFSQGARVQIPSGLFWKIIPNALSSNPVRAILARGGKKCSLFKSRPGYFEIVGYFSYYMY